jgi:hypothetical protein
MFPHYVLADNGNQLADRVIPNNLMANTSGVIQVYPQTFGNTIDKLVATSSDSSIVQIIGVEKDPIYGSFNVKIRALSAGQVTIDIAASGFSSLTLSLTISPDSVGPTNLLIKATPTTFTTSQSNVGYVAVETTNPGGIPTPVSIDTPIKLGVSDSSVVGLTNDQVVIKQGSYFTMEKFVLNKPGTATIYASSSSMQPVSTQITYGNVNDQYTLQSYAFPKVINNNNAAVGYVIVQLLQGGNPTIAKEDIPISIRVVNSTSTAAVNTSAPNPLAQVNDALVIKKGSYWAYAPVEFTAGVAGTFNVLISAKGYTISTTAGSSASGGSTTGTTSTSTSCKAVSSTAGTQFITCPQNALIDDKTPRLNILPILATGNQELIGVLQLIDPTNNEPVLAKSDLGFRIDSSDPSTISIPGVQMGYGSQAALVFAQVGNTANPVTLNVVSDAPQTVTPSITAPPSITSGLVANSLIPTVLTHTTFPLAIYMTKNGALDSFVGDLNALISPQESISPGQLTITKNDPIFLAEETLLKDGSQTMAIATSSYSSSFMVTGASKKPNSISLDYPSQIYSNNKSLFSIELLDDKQLPMLADHDIVIQLVSSDPSVMTVPASVQISKGSYYVTFEGDPKIAGTDEIAALTDGVPLSKFDITVTSFTPTVTIDAPDRADNNIPITATVTAIYNQLPLPNLNVNWKITGATIKNMDTLTNNEGKATVSLITNDPNAVNIESDVGGGVYQVVTATKQVAINAPLQPASSTPASTAEANPSPTGLTIMGLSPLLFIIPGAGAAAFIVLKKKNMLEGISERISIADKFSAIKDRMSELKQR